MGKWQRHYLDCFSPENMKTVEVDIKVWYNTKKSEIDQEKELRVEVEEGLEQDYDTLEDKAYELLPAGAEIIDIEFF